MKTFTIINGIVLVLFVIYSYLLYRYCSKTNYFPGVVDLVVADTQYKIKIINDFFNLQAQLEKEKADKIKLLEAKYSESLEDDEICDNLDKLLGVSGCSGSE